MALEERKVKDILRGGSEEITIRFDGDDLVKLPCDCEYDPALCRKDGNEVMLVRKVEIKNPDGSWSPYPSATWLDEVECEEQLVSRVLIKKTNEEGFDIMSSSQGVPDGKLLVAAEETGVYTETIDG
ncbi:MAG: hypothetical protein COX90_02090 [Candidatus Nealsonbacteria bacterium CG_4_10_14_0_2_um_filter_38_17]|uniref:Uncharacterized protein n=2 Tax=Candidatus Nealsoniibacteriota TaxID=1817911 RepID=A0A2M7UYC8_9BACT|nr:MAG: hypothetical protein COX36_01765 [Candidatus Nealsonbacteria bacterium CG23_combo_of_CG06-09_8_20_14_all_38_19]PIZ88918.1 MAG: hypothetical protein COX90_02090 [Candidatus Nealsonbacteria bacterium CG_4_10_14_0_2_um_filter_38_17]